MHQILEEFDIKLPYIQKYISDGYLLVRTADHGIDPTSQSTDHTWEHVPLLGADISRKNNVNLRMHCSFADVERIAAEFFGVSGTQL